MFGKSQNNLGVSNSPSNQGSARWANRRELQSAGLLQENGVILGRYLPENTSLLKSIAKFVLGGGADQFIRWNPEGHILTMAGTRAGKGISAVIPNLLLYPGSVVVNDPKGENYVVTSRARRQMGQKVYLLDPFDVCKNAPKASLNPFDLLDVHSSSLIEDAKLLADMLVLRSGNDKDTSWDDKARTVLSGFILYIACHAPNKDRNLGYLRRLVMAPSEKLGRVMEIMEASNHANGVIARTVTIIERMAGEERQSVLSAVERHTEFLDTPAVCKALEKSSFDLTKLKQGNTSIYLVFPPDKVGLFSRLFRLWLASAIQKTVAIQGKPRFPVLFMLDETAQFDKLEILANGVSYLAGFGISLWLVFQDLGQIKKLYPNDQWVTFFANTNIKQFFGVREYETAEYISKSVGNTTIRTNSSSSGTSSGGALSGQFQSSNQVTVSQTARALIMPNEVMNMDVNAQLIFVDKTRPFPVQRAVYFQDPEFEGLYDPNTLMLSFGSP